MILAEAATTAGRNPFSRRVWHLAHGRELELGPRGHLMGILNVTPDSFSDGGRFAGAAAAVSAGERMVEDGATIIDIGGESTRPGADPVDAATEQARVLPVIEALSKRGDTVISIDTYRAETARLGIEAGGHIINDVWGLQRDPQMAELAAELGAGVCIMHTGRERQKADDVIEDQSLFLLQSLDFARAGGIAPDAIVLDPGFGFAKDVEENVALMARFSELHALGYPLIAGTSRKRFIGAVSGRDKDHRDVASAATTAMLRLEGAAIFRVHDVAKNRDALAMADAVLARRITETEP